MVLMKADSNDSLNNVFIFYDFKQVKDMVMVVTFLEKQHRWDKILIFKNGNQWDTLSLKKYLNDEKYKWANDRLKEIFNEQEITRDFVELNTEEIKKEFPFFSKIIDEFH